MVSVDTTAFVALSLLGLLALFQIALAMGAPWGKFAMGGAYPGVFPPAMRIAALAQVMAYGVVGAIVAARAGWMLASYGDLSGVLIWATAALFLVGTILNLISRSKPERVLWTPVAAVLCAACVRLAFGH